MPVPCTCEICGHGFTVPPYRLQRGPVRFCSRPCTHRAQKQGMVNPWGRRRRTHHWEPWQLDLLRTRYDSLPGRALQSLCEDLPFPRHAIKAQARALGLGRKLGTAYRPWTEQEVDYLHAHLATSPMSELALKLRRTKQAVQLKIKKLGITKSSDGYTLRQLEPLLGMDAHKTRRMISTGLLKAARKHTERLAIQGGDAYHVTDAALKAFVIRHPEQVDLRRVDRDWFLDLLTDGAVWRHRLTALSEALG